MFLIRIEVRMVSTILGNGITYGELADYKSVLQVLQQFLNGATSVLGQNSLLQTSQLGF